VLRIHLKPGRDKSLGRRHPWIFSGAIARIEGEPGPGDVVEVRSGQGGFVAWAGFSPTSQIQARVWDWHERTRVDEAFIAARVGRAVELRKFLVEPGPRAAIRLANGEADGLPGVVIDRFADTLVLQLTSAAAWRWRDTIARAAMEATGLERVFERSDADVLALEGLEPRVGALAGPEPDGPVTVEEGGLAFHVDLRSGHKTGFYLDQRDNRALLRDLAEGRELLDCFCYTGGFAVNALAAGAAHVTAVDSSGEAIAAARRHVRLNELPEARADLIEADVFQQLRRFRDQGRRFDVIVLDPPKFAPTAAHAERAARAYKDINLWALKLLRPGGLLFTFSCSGGVPRELFQKIVAGAAVDAGADARILHHMGAAADHPVALAFPEGDYLKGLLCQAV
jgi:23S rRNA (cytosine1962-C5)-methyltransferase